MRNKHFMVYVLTTVLSFISLTGYAEEELFDTRTSTKHLEQGLAYLKANKIDAAITEFEESSAISPEAEAFYFLGYAYYLKSRKSNGESRERSRENFEKAYELDPNFSPTRYKPADPAPADTSQKQDHADSASPAATPQPPPTPAPEPSAPRS